MKRKTLLSWSSGKDSAWALHVLRADPRYEVAGLFTVVNAKYDRVAMHGARADLLRLQAKAAGLPLREIPIPDPCSDEEYAGAMRAFVDECTRAGVECMAFGDLYLEDVRAYREKQLAGTGIEPIFPLWNRPTDALVKEMLAAGLKAYIACVDTRKLPARFAGRELTEALLAEFPEGVDLCAENGEFHTVAVAGPMFREAIEVEIGEIVERDGFAFADAKGKDEVGRMKDEL
ncbi:adenine nucleotide alpha hydrolase [Candidatus Sumerlaeota bacterium]|nr:adenine nucleotide alpha hydrolase [Candidatus Sumerlaeota bacterium]